MAIKNKHSFQRRLFDMGWRVFGLEENDPYFQIHLDGSVFGVTDLCGNFNENGYFEIYSIRNRKFSSAIEIQRLFDANQFKVRWDIMERYGNKEIIGIERVKPENDFYDITYCDNCDKDTKQEVHLSNHERDSSGDYKRCLTCGWEYSGYTGEYHPPIKDEEE